MKLKIFLILIGLGCFRIGSEAQRLPTLFEKVDTVAMNHWVDSVFDSMSSDERLGQLFMIVTDPSTDTKTTQKVVNYIKNQKIGGILFSGGTLQDQALSTNLYQTYSRLPLLISFDGEWGLSMRLKNTPRFPKNMLLGAIVNDSLIYQYGKEMARECHELGIHINFAPVLDVNTNPDNPIIGTRSFGEDPKMVARKGIAYAHGLEDGGIISVAKHFPGHGDTSTDSHKALPQVTATLTHLKENELYPFVRYINEGLAGIMVGHLSVPALESSGLPTSMSPSVVTDLLHKDLKFRGLTITDALVMKGATVKNESSSVLALKAGNNILLSPADPVTDFNQIKTAQDSGYFAKGIIEQNCLKVLKYKYLSGLNHYKPIDNNGLVNRIETNYSTWLIRKLNAEGMTLLKNTDSILPIRDLEKKRIAVLSIGYTGPTNFLGSLRKYARCDYYGIYQNSSAGEIANIFASLRTYDLIICGVYSTKMYESQELSDLAKSNKLLLSFFISPYLIPRYTNTVNAARAVVMAYEDTPFAEDASAQLIMGGIPAKGRLPVTIAGFFKYGSGLDTKKIRLSFQEPYEANVDYDRLSKIDSIAVDGIAKGAYPGCQLLVAKNGAVIYDKSFGSLEYNGKIKVSNDDIYDLASVTKTTATLPAIMKLYDEKKIDLSDKIGNFVPALTHSAKKNILIRNALFHQTGLPPSLPFYEAAIDPKSYSGPLTSSQKSSLYNFQYDDNTYARNDFKFDTTLVSTKKKFDSDLQVADRFYLRNFFKEKVLEMIDESKMGKPVYRYSDLNFMLLKEVVEHVAKEPLDQYVKENFYEKLGAYHMTFNPRQFGADTTTVAPTEYDGFLRRQLLRAYVDDESAAFMGGVSGNAGLFTNAEDLAKLLQMYLDGGVYGGERFYSEETSKIFTETKSPISRRGLGFDRSNVQDRSDSPTGDLAGEGVYGHTGFTGTCFWIDPKNKLVYIFLSNRVNPTRVGNKLGRLSIRSKIQDAIYQAINK